VDTASIIDNASYVDEGCVNTLETAIHYHNAYSFNVIPISKPGEKSTQHLEDGESNSQAIKADGKSAAGYESWKQLQVQRQEHEDVVRRFEDKGDCNIAVITGTALGVLAFDIDGNEAQEHFDKAVEKLADTDISTAIKNAMITKTGSDNGKHIIFRVDPTEFQSDGEKIKTITLWIGTSSHSEIKLKGDGGYIIMPHSLHASGRYYEFINEVIPVNLSREQVHKLIEALDITGRSNQYSSFDVGNNNDENGRGRPIGEFWSLDNTNTEQMISILVPSYKEGHRDELVFGLSGLLFKNKVALVSAKNLLSTLCDRTNDEEKNSRIQVLENTYMKALNGDEISGATHLLDVLTLICNNDEVTALKKLQHLSQILHSEKKNYNSGDSDNDGNSNGFRDKTTQTLVKLIKDQTILLFKDQYGIPNVQIKVLDHTEIMPVQSRRFEHYLTKLHFDYTGGKKVAGSESLNNAIRIIYAQALFSEEEKTLHLRVAWGEKN
jgi:hypothetical protein